MMTVEELVAQIEEDIVFNVYPAGSRLVEDRLLERFDSSRYVLRTVFAELEKRGMVTRYPNRGVEVIELTPDDVDELYAVRTILETSAARMTPLPADPEKLEALDEVRRRHAQAIDARDFRAVFKLNQEFHRLQYGLCTNRRLQDAIEEYARSVHVIRAVNYSDATHIARVKQQHVDLVEALRGDDVDGYVRCVADHLPASTEGYRRSYEMKYAGFSKSAKR